MQGKGTLGMGIAQDHRGAKGRLFPKFHNYLSIYLIVAQHRANYTMQGQWTAFSPCQTLRWRD
jgi:hypothetical protein